MAQDGFLEAQENIWQYEWGKRTWVDFPPEQNLVAEEAFLNDLPCAAFRGDGHGKDGVVTISVDFNSMTQQGTVKRKIRRVAVLKARAGS